MKSNLIIESVDNLIRLLKTGADIEFGNVCLVWDLAYKQHREYLEQKKKNELAVNEDDLEMLDKLNELITAFFTRFPKRVEVPKYNTVPVFASPPFMVPDQLHGWRFNTGTEPPPTTYTTSTKWGK